MRSPTFGVLFVRRASPPSPLPALPGTVSAVLAPSPGVFVFWSKYNKRLCVRIGTYQYGPMCTRNTVGQQVVICPCHLRVGGSNLGWRLFFGFAILSCFSVGAMYFVSSVKVVPRSMKLKNVSCEIKDFVETHLCKLRGIL